MKRIESCTSSDQNDAMNAKPKAIDIPPTKLFAERIYEVPVKGLSREDRKVSNAKLFNLSE